MKTKDLRSFNSKELLDRCEERKRDIFLIKSTAPIEKKEQSARKIREHRKEIARIHTIITEREIDQAIRELSV